MKFSELDTTYCDASKSMTKIDNLGVKKNYRADTNLFGTSPEFLLYEENNYRNNSYQEPYENAIEATKGIIVGAEMCDDNLDPVTIKFFSSVNMKKIQNMIRKAVFVQTNGQYKLDVDQDESDLLIAMRAVLFDMYGARFLPFRIDTQVKNLNRQVVNYVLPDMISQLKQEYGYLKEINQPLQPLMRPINVNNAGRRTLPSVTTLWGV